MSQIPPGMPPQPNNQYQTPPSQRPMGLSIASMILGIVSIFPGCCLTGFTMLILGTAALVLGIMARKAVAEDRAGGGGMALAGIITGCFGMVVGLIFAILLLVGGTGSQGINNMLRQYQQRMQQQQQTPTSQGS